MTGSWREWEEISATNWSGPVIALFLSRPFHARARSLQQDQQDPSLKSSVRRCSAGASPLFLDNPVKAEISQHDEIHLVLCFLLSLMAGCSRVCRSLLGLTH